MRNTGADSIALTNFQHFFIFLNYYNHSNWIPETKHLHVHPIAASWSVACVLIDNQNDELNVQIEFILWNGFGQQYAYYIEYVALIWFIDMKKGTWNSTIEFFSCGTKSVHLKWDFICFNSVVCLFCFLPVCVCVCT